MSPSKSNWPIRTAALGVSALVLLAALALIVFHIPAVREQILLGAVGHFEAATLVRVEFASCRWRPFSGLSLAGVKVRSGGMTILDCEKVALSCTLSLGRPFVRVEEIFLEKPFLRLEKDREGKWRLPRELSGRGQGRAEPEADPLWGWYPLPRLRVLSGVVEGRQDGETVFSIRDFTGVLNLKTVPGPHGPEIRLDLDNWRTGGENPIRRRRERKDSPLSLSFFVPSRPGVINSWMRSKRSSFII
jgi:hypothetical protein